MTTLYNYLKLILSFCFVLVVTLTNAQNSTFTRLAQVPGLNFGLSFSPTSDGGFVTTGQDDGAGGHGSCDIYVTKVNECGVTEWYYRYGDVGGDGGKTIKQTADGGFIVSGLTEFGGGVAFNSFVMKIDALGNFQWLKSFDSGFSDYGLGVAEAPNGDFVFSGFAGVSGQLPFLARVTSTGTLLWEKTFALTGAWGNNVEVLNTGEIIFIGAYVNVTWNVFVLKLDGSGNIIWGNEYDTGGTDGIEWDVNAQVTTDGGIIIGFSNDIAATGRGYDNAIMKLDANGNVMWNTTVGTAQPDRSHFVSQTLDGGYIQTGFNDNGAGSYAILNKFDSLGVHKFTKHFGQAATVNKAWGARETSDNGILICAETTGFGAISYDPLFIKTDSLGNLPNCTIITPAITTANPLITKTDISTTASTLTNYDKGMFVSTRITVVPNEIIVCQSCNNKPQLEFNDTIICVNDTVKVYNKTTTGVICQQTIGSIDSTNIAGFTPQQAKDTTYFTYTVPGVYYIQLNAPCAANAAGSVKYQRIIVKPLPVANFTIGNICNNKPIDNTDNSQGSVPAVGGVVVSKWDWDYGDGTTHDITQNSAHTYTTKGTHTTTLIVENNLGCKDTVTKTLYVHDVPATTLTAVSKCLYGSALTSGFNFVATDSLLFTTNAVIAPSDTITKYEWDFDKNGSVDVTKNDTVQKRTQNHLYTAASNYWIKLKVSTAYCSITDSVNINIYPNPVANCIVQNVCADSAVQIIDSSYINTVFTNAIIPTPELSAVVFLYGDGGFPIPIPYPVPNPITHQYANAGKYALSQVVQSTDGCYSAPNVVDTAIVFPLPVSDFIMNDTCLTKQTTFTPTATVSVTAGSTNSIVQWQWDYTNNGSKDATNATNANVTNTYASTDTSKYASLVVKTNHGCKDSLAKKIVVHPNPVANFTPKSICLGGASVFTNTSSIQSGTITSNYWQFDATGTSIVKNPSYTYLFANTHSTKLIVTSGFGCTDSITKNVQVFPLPTPNLLTQAVCEDSLITIVDKSTVNNALPNPIVPNPTIDSIYFIYDDGTLPSMLKNPNLTATHLYAAPGKYYINQVVKSSNGCYNIHKDSVVIYPNPVVDFTMTDTCINFATTFTPTATITNAAGSTSTITNWYWDYTSNKSVEANNTSPINASYIYPSNDTNKFATLVVKTNHGCKDSLAQKIIIHPNPVVNFNVFPVCMSAPSLFENTSSIKPSYTFTNYWQFITIDNSTDLNPIYTFKAPNDYQVKLVVTSNKGCKDSITQTATVYPNPDVYFKVTPNVICQPDVITYIDSSSIGAVPAGSVITDYKWNIGNEPEVQGIQGQMLLKDTGNYDVTLTAYSNYNCFSFKTIPNMVRVNLKPTALFTVSPTETTMLNPIINIRDASLNATKYDWSTGDTSFAGSVQFTNFLHQYREEGEYTIKLMVRTANGCTDTMSALVVIKPNWTIFVPNSFTPDGDGINEYFNARGTGLLVYKLRIFDRWGHVVGLVENITSKGWDGIDISNNTKVKADVYTWSLEFSDINGYEQKRTGTVTLMR